MEYTSKNLEHICAREEIVDLCMEHCIEGFIKLKDEEVLAYNRRADRLLELGRQGDDLSAVLGENKLQTLLTKGMIKEEIGNRFLSMKSFPIQKGCTFIMVQDLSIEENMKDELNNIREINNELQHTFETYSDNTLYVCDSHGKTLWAGSDIACNCGVTEDYLKEHTVMELEKERVFYPSVAVKVLKSKKAEIVTQITAIGKTGISIGIPVFNSREEMTHIISLTRDLGYTLKLGQLLSEQKQPKKKQEAEFVEMVACSPVSIKLMGMIRNIAKVNATVLIQAEPGNGKDTVAHLIHKLGRRRMRHFEKMNCQELSASGQEKALFGSAKEQGLLQTIGDGILYIDEVQEMSLKCQRKLMRYLKEKEVERKTESRLLFSTSVDLKEAVTDKTFLKELYQIISVVTLEIQPLRERREDIPLLIKHFTREANEKYQVEKSFAKETAAVMEVYSWPGNVRELKNVVERAVITSATMLIEREDLPAELAVLGLPPEEKEPSGLTEAVARLECQMIREALKECGTASLAAKQLGVNQSTISRKIKKYGIALKEQTDMMKGCQHYK